MTDLAITASEVQPGEGGTFENGIAGEAITAGQTVYLDATARTFKLCDADSATAGVRKVRGIALNGAATGQPLRIKTHGPVTLGAAAAMAIGETYISSDTPGGIRPIADVDTGDEVAILGVAASATSLDLRVNNSGVVHA